MISATSKATSGLYLSLSRPLSTSGGPLQGWDREHKPMPRFPRRSNSHKPQQWAKLRAAKVLKVDLPDIALQRRMVRKELSPAEMRLGTKFRLKGLN